jgi:hypothetical protein
LPEQAIAEEWVPRLKKIIRQDRFSISVVLLEFGLFIAVGTFLIFNRPDDPWFGVVCTALFTGMVVWLPFAMHRRRARIRRLLAKFRRRSRFDDDGLWFRAVTLLLGEGGFDWLRQTSHFLECYFPERALAAGPHIIAARVAHHRFRSTCVLGGLRLG